jgi:succinate dehydrogenase / fumarate reductase, cytochrome b subunit
MSVAATSFFGRHDFLIRRLHSLSGLIPVGAYMVVHLLVNSTIINGPGAFQNNVNQIHSLGLVLPAVEWGFIFIPLLFHMLVGLWIIRTGKPNHDQYRYVSNWRYTWQRWTGVIATVFILLHVFHLHGWFHAEWWMRNVAEPLGMAKFRPYNAASTLALAMSGYVWPVFYVVGVLASCFHLANGIWTMGITWGVWVSPRAQRGASTVCAVFGVLLAFLGLSTILTVTWLDVEHARTVEDAMYNQKVETGEIIPNTHKRSIIHTEHGVEPLPSASASPHAPAGAAGAVSP